MSTRAAHGAQDVRTRPRSRPPTRARFAVRRLAHLWVLARPGTALADGVPLAVGALAVPGPRVATVLVLVLAGALVSVHGRLLDAVAGLGADRINPARRGSPLVRGRIGSGGVLGAAVAAGLAVAVGGLLAAPVLAARLGFVVLIGSRAMLAATRGPARRLPVPLRGMLTLVAVGGGPPLGVLAAGGEVGGGALALGACFGLAAVVAGCTIVSLPDLPTDRVTGRRGTEIGRAHV